MGLIGAGVQFMGSMMSASAAQAEGAKAKEIADLNAKRLRESGQYQARQIRKQAGMANSRAIAQAGARGLAVSGSVLDVMMDTAVQGEIDAVNTAKAAEAQAHIQTLEGEAAVQRANNRATAHIIGGFSSFLRMAA